MAAKKKKASKKTSKKAADKVAKKVAKKTTPKRKAAPKRATKKAVTATRKTATRKSKGSASKIGLRKSRGSASKTAPRKSKGKASKPAKRPAKTETRKAKAAKKAAEAAKRAVEAAKKAVRAAKKATDKAKVAAKAAKKPAKKAVSKKPVRKAVSKKPVRKAVSKKPVRKAVSKKPVRKAVSKKRKIRDVAAIGYEGSLAPGEPLPDFPIPEKVTAEPRIIHTHTAAVDWFDEGDGTHAYRTMITSRGNSLQKTNVEEVLDSYFHNKAAAAGASDPDAIDLFRYGIVARARGPYTETEVHEMRRELENQLGQILPADWVTHIVNEGNTVSVRVAAGSPDKASDITSSLREMRNDGDVWADVFKMLEDAWFDGDWFAFADIDEDWDRGS